MNPILTPQPSVDPYYEANRLDFLTSPTGAVLGAAAEEAWRFNPAPTIFRALERSAQAGGPAGRYQQAPEPVPMLDAEAANARFGIEGELSFSSPVPAATAADLRQLKMDELRRRDVFARRRGGFLETAAMLGVGLGVSALDPLNIASAFIPAIGPERAAALIARAASPVGRATARAGVGAVEGGFGALLVEPIIAAGAAAEQADYGAADSLLNVAFGVALGAGLHVGAGVVRDVFSRARSDGDGGAAVGAGATERPSPLGNREIYNLLPVEQKRAELGAAVAQLVETGTVARMEAVSAAASPRLPTGGIQSVTPTENLARGTEAAARALASKGDVPAAMYREDVGEITFRYGAAGDPARAFAGGHGLAHIEAKHGAETATTLLPEVLARGTLARYYGPAKRRRADIVLRDMRAVLAFDRHGTRETWVVTAFRKKGEGGPGGTGGVNPRSPYADPSAGITGDPGAGPRENIETPPPPDNPDQAIAAAAEQAVKETEARQADPEKALIEEVDALEQELARLDPAKLLAYARDPEAGPLDPKRLAGLMGADPEAVRRALDHLAATTGAVKKTDAGRYRRPAKEGPLDLLQFIAKHGGLRDDEGHDLARGRDAQRFIPRYGALIRKAGRSLDDMGEALHEAGYFGDPGSTPRPDEAQILEALDEALRGKKAYRLEDEAEVAARAAEQESAEFEARAKDAGAEVVELAKAMGETIGEAEALQIGRRAVADGMDAEAALVDHVERLAIEAEDAIRADTGRADLGEEIPFEDVEPRQDGGPARTDEPAAEGQQADAQEGAAGGEAPAQARQDFTESTDQGEQLVAGALAAPVTDRARAELGMATGLKAKAPQQSERGLALFGGEIESAVPDTADMFARADPAVARADAAEAEAKDTSDAIDASADCLTRRGG